MAFVRIRGEQIQLGAIKDEHIASGAAIAESKLSIDWAARYADALKSKFMLDTVQKDGVVVAAGAASFALESIPAAGPNELGVVLGANVIVRNAATGEPIKDAAGQEVVATLAHNGTEYTLDMGVAFDGTVNILYVQRFTLYSISESAMMNERFVDGAADVGARLDLTQLAADLGINLNRNGQMSLTKSVIDQLADEVARAKSAESVLQGNLDTEASTRSAADSALDARITTEINDRTAADQAIKDELASGAGAGKVGFTPASGLTSTTVQAAIEEVKNLAGNGTADSMSKLASNDIGKGSDLVGFAGEAGVTVTAKVNTVKSTLDSEIARATAAEQAVDARVTQEIADRTAAVSAEQTRAVNAEAALDAKIAQEVTDRTAAVAAEAAAREAADTLIKTDLASTDLTKGATLVGVNSVDIGLDASVTTAAGALKALKAAVDAEAAARIADVDAEESRATAAEVALGGRIDTEIADRTAAVAAVDAKVAQEVLDRQAAVTAEADARTLADGALQTAIDNEAAARLAKDNDLQTQINNLQSGSSTALAQETADRQAADAALQAEIDTVEAEVVAARGTAANLDARLDRALNENGTLKAGTKIHTHKKAVIQVDAALAGQSIVTVAEAFQDDAALNIFVNGVLQVKGLHFTVGADLKSIDFSPETLYLGDVVVIDYVINEVE